MNDNHHHPKFHSLAASQHSVLTRRQAAGVGLTRYRISALLRDGILDEPVPAVLRLRGSVATWRQGLSIAVLAGGDNAVASHRSAARLHRLDGFARSRWVEVSISRCRRHEVTGIRVAVTDLGIPAVRLGLEGHSRQYHFGPLQEPLDEQRDLRVAACGWELLYLGWHAAHRPADVARTLRSVIRARREALRAA